MKIKVTEADMKAAYFRLHFKGWEKFMEEARQQAAARLLAANQADQKRLCDESTALVGQPGRRHQWLAVQDRLTKVFAEHGELLDAAYPRAKETAE